MRPKLFATRNFLKSSRIPLRNFSALWDINISTENRDMPLLSMNFFDTKIFLENWRLPLRCFSFRSCETKKIDKTVIPPSYAWQFSIKRFSETPKCSPVKCFVQWDKNFSTENRDTSLPLIHKNFFPTRFFLKHRMIPWRSFPGPVRFRPPLLENFRYQNSVETQKCSPTNFIGTVRQKFFDGV